MYMFCKYCKKESSGQYINFWRIRLFGKIIIYGDKGNRCPFCHKKNKKACLYEKVNNEPELFVANGGGIPKELFPNLYNAINKGIKNDRK